MSHKMIAYKDARELKDLFVNKKKSQLYDLYAAEFKGKDKGVKDKEAKDKGQDKGAKGKGKRSKTDEETSDSGSDFEPESSSKPKPKPKKKRISIGPKSFSKWTWPMVCEKLDILHPHVDESKFPKTQHPVYQLTACEKDIKIELDIQEDFQVDKFGFGNESVCANYVMLILRGVKRHFKITNIAVTNEHLLTHEDAWGPVEFVLTARNARRSPVGFIVEVKQDDFNQGRAQLYMKLRATRKENTAAGVVSNVVGAITNGETWVFVLYNGEAFYETSKCLVGQSPTYSNLHIVVSNLAAALDYASGIIAKGK